MNTSELKHNAILKDKKTGRIYILKDNGLFWSMVWWRTDVFRWGKWHWQKDIEYDLNRFSNINNYEVIR